MVNIGQPPQNQQNVQSHGQKGPRGPHGPGHKGPHGPHKGGHGGGLMVQINTLQAEIDSMPDGPDKVKKEQELTDLQGTLSARIQARAGGGGGPRPGGFAQSGGHAHHGPPAGVAGQGSKLNVVG